MRRGWGLRIRKFVDDWFVIFVIALVLVAGAGAWLAYDAHTNPETVTQEFVVDSWSERGSFSYSTTVIQPNEVFPEGEELTGQPTYYTAISPTVDGEFEYVYDATSGGNLDVTTDVQLILRSADDDAVYWSVEEPLESNQETGVSPNEVQSASFSIDVPQIDSRLDAIEESLGASPGSTETLVRASVSVSGTVNGESVSGVQTYDFIVDPGGATYQIENPGTETVQYETTQTETMVLDPDPQQVYGFGGLAALALLGAIGLGIGRYYDVVGPTERELLIAAREQERAEFDDWISRGRMPTGFTNRPQIEIESLEDIVDIAIDSDCRVIETPDEGAYYVLDGDLLYVYRPDPIPDATDPLSSSTESETGTREEPQSGGFLSSLRRSTDGGAEAGSPADVDDVQSSTEEGSKDPKTSD